MCTTAELVGVDRASLAAAVADLDRLAARVAVAAAEYERAGLFEGDGSASMRAWLIDEGMDPGAAVRLLRTGRRLLQLRALREAAVGRELASGQVQAVVANVPDAHVGLFAEGAGELLPTLAHLSVGDVARVMQSWRLHAEAHDELAEGDLPDRSFHHSQTLGGRYVSSGDFDVEGGAVIAKALDVAQDRDFKVPAARRRGDALVEVARFFLDHHDTLDVPRNRPHVTVLVDAAGHAELLEENRPLDRATVSRILCDADLSRGLADRLAKGRSALLDLGTSTRVVSKHLREALVIRDRHCRWPGCDRPPRMCEAHHVRFFRDGGPTRLDNLVLLCTRHHHLLHSTRVKQATLDDHAALAVTMADGTQRITHPPP